MWITWLLLVALSIGLVISQLVSLLRSKPSGTASHAEAWSPGQNRLLKVLQLSGAIGAVIIWMALVYVVIDSGGQHLMQPWRNKTQLWAVPYALLYTSFFLGLMRNSNFLPVHVFWRPSRRLWFWAFIIVAFFFATMASIADLFFPPPAGSRKLARFRTARTGRLNCTK